MRNRRWGSLPVLRAERAFSATSWCCSLLRYAFWGEISPGRRVAFPSRMALAPAARAWLVA